MANEVSLWTAEEIAKASNGTAHGDFSVTGITFDSREVEPGDLFVAMRGEQADGHNYIDAAVERGAAGILCERETSAPHVRVADGLAALQALGRAARSRTSAKIIGVTGSVGKTSTKELLRVALEENFPGAVHASVKSYNNHTGVPLSLARMPRDCRYGVFEMGMNHAGELAERTRIVRPDVACVTWIAPAHIEYFDSVEAIADAKAEIFEGLEPGGVAILPRDSEHYERLRRQAEEHAALIVTFGAQPDADVELLRDADLRDYTIAVARLAGQEITFTLRQTGRHWISNAICALAAAHAAGADPAVAALGLAQLGGLPGRGERSTLAWDGGELTVIDESYNANPTSMAAALAVLGAAPASQRRVAVLGAMKELGSQSDALHAGLAEPIANAKVDRLYLVGAEMTPLAERVEAVSLPDWKAARDALYKDLKGGDTVLLKGSNSVGLGQVVKALKERED